MSVDRSGLQFRNYNAEHKMSEFTQCDRCGIELLPNETLKPMDGGREDQICPLCFGPARVVSIIHSHGALVEAAKAATDVLIVLTARMDVARAELGLNAQFVNAANYGDIVRVYAQLQAALAAEEGV
jgi:hypothetical protein